MPYNAHGRQIIDVTFREDVFKELNAAVTAANAKLKKLYNQRDTQD